MKMAWAFLPSLAAWTITLMVNFDLVALFQSLDWIIMPPNQDSTGNHSGLQKNRGSSSFFCSNFARFLFLAVIIPVVALQIIQTPLNG